MIPTSPFPSSLSHSRFGDMTDHARRHAVYLLQLRDDLDRLEGTRWEWVAPGVMSLVTTLLSVGMLVGGVVPAGLALGLIAGATGRHAVRTERDRRAEIRAILVRIRTIEERRPPSVAGPPGDHLPPGDPSPMDDPVAQGDP